MLKRSDTIVLGRLIHGVSLEEFGWLAAERRGLAGNGATPFKGPRALLAPLLVQFCNQTGDADATRAVELAFPNTMTSARRLDVTVLAHSGTHEYPEAFIDLPPLLLVCAASLRRRTPQPTHGSVRIRSL